LINLDFYANSVLASLVLVLYQRQAGRQGGGHAINGGLKPSLLLFFLFFLLFFLFFLLFLLSLPPLPFYSSYVVSYR
jgi:hypothetical protein